MEVNKKEMEVDEKEMEEEGGKQDGSQSIQISSLVFQDSGNANICS